MLELSDQYHLVAGFSSSCRMNTNEIQEYKKLNKLYNEVTKTNVTYSVCKKKTLLDRVKAII